LLCPALAYLSTSEQSHFFQSMPGALKTAQDSPTVQILFFTWLRSNLGNSHVFMHGMLWLFLPIWFIQKRSQSNCPQLTKSPNIVNWLEHIDQIYEQFVGSSVGWLFSFTWLCRCHFRMHCHW
jgi:hypothetical protein